MAGELLPGLQGLRKRQGINRQEDLPRGASAVADSGHALCLVAVRRNERQTSVAQENRAREGGIKLH